MMKKRILLTICLSLLLLACSGKNGINKNSKWDLSKYSVQRGDTLYSIAWRYDLDFKQLAKWNKISRPYLIVPGQRLTMRAPIVVPPGKTYLFGGTQKTPSVTAKYKPAIDYSQPNNIPPPPPVLNSKNSGTKVKQAIPVYNRKKTVVPVVTKTKVVKTSTRTRVSTGPIKWSWPINGKVISKFAANNNNRKGIDIKGLRGQKVRSASNGIVVYSGAGLISYGQLIIIKHSDRFLSAYAFNKKLLVKEGARVNKGQSIAIIGKKLNVTNLLHFEIRKDGKPVNPLVYLP